MLLDPSGFFFMALTYPWLVKILGQNLMKLKITCKNLGKTSSCHTKLVRYTRIQHYFGDELVVLELCKYRLSFNNCNLSGTRNGGSLNEINCTPIRSYHIIIG